MRQLSYRALVDTCRIIKQLWRGETVVYDGPAGKYDGIKLEDGPIPKITMFHFGGPAASVAAADPVFDEVGFSIMLRPEAMRDSIAITAKECERIGRDPDAIHYIAPVASACELSDDDTLMLIAARIVIYLQVPEAAGLRAEAADGPAAAQCHRFTPLAADGDRLGRLCRPVRRRRLRRCAPAGLRLSAVGRLQGRRRGAQGPGALRHRSQALSGGAGPGQGHTGSRPGIAQGRAG